MKATQVLPELPLQPQVVIKATFFVNKYDGTKLRDRTQVWMSMRASSETRSRDVVIAAFRHAMERLGGARLDDHPTKMLSFVQSHGEFILLEKDSTPLLSHEVFVDLVKKEGRSTVLMALVSMSEYKRLNPAAAAANAATGASHESCDTELRVAAAERAESSAASSSEQSVVPPDAAASASRRFHGRSRAASLLPDAFSHDPLPDKRFKPAGSVSPVMDPLSRSNSGSGFAVENLDDSFLGDGRAAAAAAAAVASTSGPRVRTGTVCVVLVTYTGEKFETIVQYPLGSLCRELVERALEQFAAAAAQAATSNQGPTVSSSGAAPAAGATTTATAAARRRLEQTSVFGCPKNALVLWYASEPPRKFKPDDVIPVSRGARTNVIRLFLGIDQEALGREAPPPPGGTFGAEESSVASNDRRAHGGGRGRGDSASRSATIRIAGSAASLTGRRVTSSGTSLLLPVDVGAGFRERLEAYRASERWPLEPHDDDAEQTEGSLLVAELLNEECRARLAVVEQQLALASLQADLETLAAARKDVEAQIVAEEDAARVWQRESVEGAHAIRDIQRLDNLIEWFEADIQQLRERQRATTKQLFEMDRPGHH